MKRLQRRRRLNGSPLVVGIGAVCERRWLIVLEAVREERRGQLGHGLRGPYFGPRRRVRLQLAVVTAGGGQLVELVQQVGRGHEGLRLERHKLARWRDLRAGRLHTRAGRLAAGIRREQQNGSINCRPVVLWGCERGVGLD